MMKVGIGFTRACLIIALPLFAFDAVGPIAANATHPELSDIPNTAEFQESAAFTGQLRTITVDGSNAVIRLWNECRAGEGCAEYYSIAPDGQIFSRLREVQRHLMLRYATFDPLIETPFIEPSLNSRAGDRIFVVQFIVPALQEFRDALEARGGRILHFIPHQAYVVDIDADAAAALKELPFVRFVGHYHPAFRLDENLRALLMGQSTASTGVRCHIQVWQRGPGQKQSVAERIEALGGSIDVLHDDGFRFEATLTPDMIRTVARFDEVAFMDPWTEAGTDMDITRASTGADYVEVVEGFSGQGVRGEVMEIQGTFLNNHPDFQARPPLIHANFAGNPDHGTSTYGICFGAGAINPAGRGMLPDAQGIFAGVAGSFNRYQHTAELLAAPYNAVFQSNSWGNLWTANYTTLSAELDDILLNHQIVLLQSMSNQGNQQARPQAWSKNVVSVGGVFHENTATFLDDHWTFGASIGPAADGRIKPDLVHYYDSIYTTAADGGYRQFCCTSASTPIVAGHFGLFFQMWAQGLFGNTVDDTQDVFSNRPRMATAKAMMINAARSYPFSGLAADLTRTHQGWGLADVQRLHSRRERMFIVNETDVLTHLAVKAYPVVVLPGEAELRVTMVYTDPAGLPATSMHRINDLSLRVVSPSQGIYWGNAGLRSGNWSVSGGVSNLVDTVENVFLQDPEAGTWLVEVYADEINLDSHLETPAVDADFALVVSGASAPMISGDCDADLDVELTDYGHFFGCLAGPWPAPVGVECTCADFNGDQKVDLADVAEFQNRFDCAPPLLLVSPSGGSICPTESTTLTALASGNAPLQYQWFRNDMAIEGANGSTYTINSFQDTDNGTYTVRVSNACGVTISPPATLVSCAVLFFDTFETDQGWSVVNDPEMTRGQWLRSLPVQTSNGFYTAQPAGGFPDGTGFKCFVTGPFGGMASANDVDGGPTVLYSPILDLSGHGPIRLRYAYWYYRDDGENLDALRVAVSPDAGATWVDLHEHFDPAGEWRIQTLMVNDYVAPTSQMQFRFLIEDANADSILEALIDNVMVSAPQ